MRELDLSPTGEMDEGPDALIATAKLKTGWQILWYNKYGCPFLEEDDLKRLSVRFEILRCLVEEHVMASSSELWLGGGRKWWISHEGEEGPKGIAVEGDPPDCYAQTRRDMESEQAAAGGDQAGVDYIFEIPLLVAKSITGFKHDETCNQMVEPAFSVLARKEQPRPNIFAKLFRKK